MLVISSFGSWSRFTPHLLSKLLADHSPSCLRHNHCDQTSERHARPSLIDGFSDLQIGSHPTTPAKESALRAKGSVSPGWPPLFTTEVRVK